MFPQAGHVPSPSCLPAVLPGCQAGWPPGCLPAVLFILCCLSCCMFSLCFGLPASCAAWLPGWLAASPPLRLPCGPRPFFRDADALTSAHRETARAIRHGSHPGFSLFRSGNRSLTELFTLVEKHHLRGTRAGPQNAWDPSRSANSGPPGEKGWACREKNSSSKFLAMGCQMASVALLPCSTPHPLK